ncbi:MAG: hypothetical protein DME21_03145 [Verrucomicrobia bacterium]|nr:MAG: hypothetical protein DME21_03145 [Verrucomicrobiota bacterium]
MKTKTLAMKTQRPHSLKILAVSLLLSVIASSAQETGSLPTVTMAANNSAPGQDLFVSEANGSVAKISPDGAQSIFAAGMKRPLGLAVDRAGNLFVADGFSATIYKFTPDGAGSAFATNIYSPFALAFDSAGNLFATDDYGSVYVFNPDGAHSLFASGMQHTSALAFDSAGNLFVTDSGSASNDAHIYKFTPVGAGSTFASGLDESYGLASKSAGDLFYSDYLTGDIYRFTAEGQQSTFASGLNYPDGLAFDGAGILYVADPGSGNIYKFTTDGARSTLASGLNGPTFIAFAPNTAPVDTTPPTVTVTTGDSSAGENDLNAGWFTISRTGDTGAALTVYFTIGGTATSGSDYQPLGDSVSIPAGAVSADVVVQPIDDSEAEGTETVVLTLSSNAVYMLESPSSATVTITDNDTLPVLTVQVTDPNASETGPDPGTFTISRSGDTNSDLTVYYTFGLGGGTASYGTDYQTVPGTAGNPLPYSVTIPASATSVAVTVVPIDDDEPEPSETVVLTLYPDYAHEAYKIGEPANATVTIADNDPVVTDPTIRAGNLFVSDGSGRGNIYQFAPDGTRSTFASGLSGGLAFDQADNLFVAAGDIYKFAPD